MANCKMPHGHPTHCGCEPDPLAVQQVSSVWLYQLRKELIMYEDQCSQLTSKVAYLSKMVGDLEADLEDADKCHSADIAQFASKLYKANKDNASLVQGVTSMTAQLTAAKKLVSRYELVRDRIEALKSSEFILVMELLGLEPEDYAGNFNSLDSEIDRVLYGGVSHD